MSDRNCVIGSKPHAATHGLLCDNHLQRLGATLRDIEDEAVHLSAVPSMQQASGSRGGSLGSERAPARIEVLAVLDPRTRRWQRADFAKHPLPAPKSFGPWCLFCDHETCTDWRAGRQRDLHDDEHDAGSDRLMSVLRVLHSWARVVREDRELTAPARITITGERDLLTRQLLWIAEQPWADETYSDLKALLASLQRFNGTLEVSVGKCDSLQPSGFLCTGKVWHIEIKHADGPDEPGFRCDTCRRVWTGTEAVRKRHAMWLDEQERKAAS